MIELLYKSTEIVTVLVNPKAVDNYFVVIIFNLIFKCNIINVNGDYERILMQFFERIVTMHMNYGYKLWKQY